MPSTLAPEPVGLTEASAAERLRAIGPNVLPDPDHRGFGRILLEVLREPMFALLLVGGAVYLALGDLREALVLVAFALLSVTIAVFQEYRSERVLQALRDLTSPQATVLRDGVRRRIASRDLVPGDVIAFAEGERAPADAAIRSGVEIEVDESLLTGESAAVRKQPSASVQAMQTPGGEDTPFLYCGALLVRGQGLAEVIATGARSEIGRIGAALRSIEEQPTRLSLETRRIVRISGAAAFVVCGAVVLITGVVRGAWLQGVLGGVSLGMAQTGTLTLNRMTLFCAWQAGEIVEWTPGEPPPPAVRDLLTLGTHASAPHPFDPMEQAFHAAAPSAAGGWALERTYGLTRDCLAMAQVWRGDGELRVAVKGAPEAVLRLCRIDGPGAAEILQAVESMAARGARVLAIAQGRPGNGALPASAADFALTLTGLVGLADPLRPDVPAAVAECRTAGVRVIMITGDYPATARVIATQAGITEGDMLTGDDLRALSELELAARIKHVSVFARILPEQKLRIVQALQAVGEVVAMTGDGVNDAPALKAADIGIAMGARGSDVARAAADLVLLNDDFGSIVHAMRLGRRIYDNLQKAMGFILAVHIPIAGLALLPLLLGLPVFLAPAHIAFLEMIIDPVCSIVFEAEAEEADIMRRPPRDPRVALFTGRRIAACIMQGVVVLAVVAATYGAARAWDFSPESVRTAAFLALVLSVFGLVVANRTFSSVWAAVVRPNAALGLIVVGVLAAVLAVVSFPSLRDLFYFGRPDGRGFLLAGAAGLVSLTGLDLLKRLSPAWRRMP